MTKETGSPAFSRLTLAIIGLVLCAAPAKAQPQIFPDFELTTDPPFGKNLEARTNISGSACAPVPRPVCLAVNDEKKYAQFFTMSGTRITPGDVIRLLPDQQGPVFFKEIDAEGAAYGPGFFYVIGSHGRGRNSLQLSDSRFMIFRFPVDPQTGKPTFDVSDEVVAPQIQRSDRLRSAIAGAPQIGPFAENPLDQNGANIEGIAIARRRMFLGFRAPSIDGNAFIMSVTTDAVFSQANLGVQIHPIALGPGLGIRDLAPVANGFLILAGPVADQPAPPSLFLWDPATGNVRHLADLVQPANGKAEALLVLQEDPEFYNLLVMFDGFPNGRPTHYHVPL